jgi:ferric-dicitrate binding protein FerR (iron transport regulator)
MVIEIYNKALLRIEADIRASLKEYYCRRGWHKNYTAWKDGNLFLKTHSLKILKKLERHFNVSIVNNNAKLSEQYFDAKFDIETIEQVLNAFNKSSKIQYTIEDNQIIIN